MPIRVDAVYRVIVAVSEHIESGKAVTCAGIAIRVDESANFGVIVAGLEVIEAGFGIVIVATIAQKESYAFVKPSLHHSKSPSLRRMLYGSISKSAFLAEALFL